MEWDELLYCCKASFVSGGQKIQFVLISGLLRTGTADAGGPKWRQCQRTETDWRTYETGARVVSPAAEGTVWKD